MTQTVKNMVGLMGWAMPEQGYRKGPWTPEEDQLLSEYVTSHGEGRWSSVARCAGLSRSGKSCRLRWVNYLRPGLKRGQITPQEEGIITELHALWGNKWSTIARYLPGRTDNEIKNYWRTHFKRKEKSTRKSFERKKSQNPKPPKPLLPKPQELEAKQPQIERTNNILLPQQFPTTPDQQELTFMYANMCTSDLNEHDLSSPWIEDATCHNQDGLWWDSLWDFDDHGSVADQIHQDEYCSKIASSAHNHVISTNYNINNSINNNNNNNHDDNIQSNNAFHLLGRGSKPFVQ